MYNCFLVHDLSGQYYWHCLFIVVVVAISAVSVVSLSCVVFMKML